MGDLKAKRKELNMTQTDVAKAIGCSLSSYRMWEIGVTKPTEKNLVKLRQVLRLDSLSEEVQRHGR